MTQAEQIVAAARKKLGSSKYSGKCQAFVADVYHEVQGGTRQSKATAALAEQAWKISTRKDNIPLAAAVYFSGSAGHVGIYSGNGKVIHAFPKIVETSIAKAGTFHGWGYNGGNAHKPDGAVVDGKSGTTDAAVTSASASLALSYGCSGTRVRELQRALNARGYSLDVDGSFGSATLAAVKDFQKNNGLTVDGVVDPETKKALGLTTSSGTSTASSGSSAASSSTTSSTTSSSSEKSVDITKVVVKSISGSAGASREQSFKNVTGGLTSGLELLIKNDKAYAPVLVGDVTLTRKRSGSPATLKFEVVKDSVLDFQEGNPVSVRFNGSRLFYGYVFTKERGDIRTISVTAYDQLRYFKNEDTISYTGKTYNQLVKMLADDYGLTCGTLEDTSYVINNRIEEGSLLEMCANASDLTTINTGKIFVLYDDFGEITLKSFENLATSLAFTEDNCESFSYTSTIDEQTYNKIKLATDNDKTGEREIYISQDSDSQSRWGVLQYYANVSDATAELLKTKGKVLLDYYNRKTRTLKLSGCSGNIGVRGGSLVFVQMNIGDLALSNYMMVEEATHKFSAGKYTMDLSLSGLRGEFVV